MKYENAQDLLPEELLTQVQKYISGKLVYIPAREHHREWAAYPGISNHCWIATRISARSLHFVKPFRILLRTITLLRKH